MRLMLSFQFATIIPRFPNESLLFIFPFDGMKKLPPLPPQEKPADRSRNKRKRRPSQPAPKQNGA